MSVSLPTSKLKMIFLFFTLIFVNGFHCSAMSGYNMLDSHERDLVSILIDGDALEKEMKVVENALKEAEFALKTSFSEMSAKEEQLQMLGLELKEVLDLKNSLELSTMDLQDDLVDAKNNLLVATDEWHEMDDEFDRIKSEAIPASSQVASCKQWGGLLAESNVMLEEKVLYVNQTNLHLQKLLQNVSNDLIDSNNLLNETRFELEALKESSEDARVEYRKELVALEQKSKQDREKVTQCSAQASIKDSRILSLEKSLANRTITTKKSEARSMLLTDHNQKLVLLERALRVELDAKLNLLNQTSEALSQLNQSLKEQQETNLIRLDTEMWLRVELNKLEELSIAQQTDIDRKNTEQETLRFAIETKQVKIEQLEEKVNRIMTENQMYESQVNKLEGVLKTSRSHEAALEESVQVFSEQVGSLKQQIKDRTCPVCSGLLDMKQEDIVDLVFTSLEYASLKVVDLSRALYELVSEGVAHTTEGLRFRWDASSTVAAGTTAINEASTELIQWWKQLNFSFSVSEVKTIRQK